MEKEDFNIIIAAICLVLALGLLTFTLGVSLGVKRGYKIGQLDYAQNKIEYTIDEEGRTIHYLNK